MSNDERFARWLKTEDGVAAWEDASCGREEAGLRAAWKAAKEQSEKDIEILQKTCSSLADAFIELNKIVESQP